ncbi:MAG: alpha/beta fold hydrolase [Synechococcales bacterium]|nr:alpha/beta fold hydrolase [Synechococcales bacterium]
MFQSVTEPRELRQTERRRTWIWRGWRIHYTYLRAAHPSSNRPPLLLIHGFGASLDQWHGNLQALAQHQDVYALDLLGFGTSEKAAIAYRVALWADQIYAFWQTLIGRPMILVGHSLGALASATAAAAYPETVRGVVLMTLPATRQEIVTAPWMQAMTGTIERLVASPLAIRLIFQVVRRPAFLRAGLRLAYANRDRVTNELVQSFARPTCDRGAAQTLCRLTQAATQTDYSLSRRALLDAIRCPILLLWGQQDRVVPITQGRELIQHYPHLSLTEIPQAGHCLYDECAERVNQEILDWAAALERREFTDYPK